MGGKCPHRSVKKRRYSHKTARRTKFLVKDILFFVFLISHRFFASAEVRDEHFKTKRHRKRLKLMAGPAPHTQLDAELAAGMGMPDNGPKLMAI
ncbi:OLC1v1034496C1 [Oldenlandia corymbosa var. corymbosa]|uniref:OLC1v1034496C1 n=1 Tax=Oldenlandia corymbosa var. corymbosa TaxID=529605 RepID=A0AAV1CQP3_OLDCO|nr:OLC1v1034496C1 [Oldenlandia corymbosa var. corymbosa]